MLAANDHMAAATLGWPWPYGHLRELTADSFVARRKRLEDRGHCCGAGIDNAAQRLVADVARTAGSCLHRSGPRCAFPRRDGDARELTSCLEGNERRKDRVEHRAVALAGAAVL